MLPNATSLWFTLVAKGGRASLRAVVAAMILLGRLEEIILMAPTGAAADNIDGNTYHTSLGISIRTNHQERPRNGFNGYGPRRPL